MERRVQQSEPTCRKDAQLSESKRSSVHERSPRLGTRGEEGWQPLMRDTAERPRRKSCARM